MKTKNKLRDDKNEIVLHKDIVCIKNQENYKNRRK